MLAAARAWVISRRADLRRAPSMRSTAHLVRCSDALAGFQPPGLHCLYELLVVLLVLVGIPFGEAGDRGVELVAVTQVFGGGNRIARPGVSPRQRPPADARV